MEMRVCLIAAPPGWYGTKGIVEYCHCHCCDMVSYVGLNRMPRKPRLSGRKNYERKRQAARRTKVHLFCTHVTLGGPPRLYDPCKCLPLVATSLTLPPLGSPSACDSKVITRDTHYITRNNNAGMTPPPPPPLRQEVVHDQHIVKHQH